ncbi:MAG: hypothetical protein Kilf2KO_47720 [Rhodospirillales bacterium]
MAKAKSPQGESTVAKAQAPPAPSRRPVDLSHLAARHGKTMIEVLVTIACDPELPAAARVAAAKEVLERGHGRAPTHVNLDGNQRVTHQSAGLSETAVWLAELIGSHCNPAPQDPVSN